MAATTASPTGIIAIHKAFLFMGARRGGKVGAHPPPPPRKSEFCFCISGPVCYFYLLVGPSMWGSFFCSYALWWDFWGLPPPTPQYEDFCGRPCLMFLFCAMNSVLTGDKHERFEKNGIATKNN